jgi:luciferase family oxidoreductase group 1
VPQTSFTAPQRWSGTSWISVLESATVGPGVPASKALAYTTAVAEVAEALGLTRLWLSEHHSTPDIASSSPAVLLAHLAVITARLRLGAGGVMLRNHAPLAIAEQFATLAALHPGRIDLGVGRGTGGPPAAHEALAHLGQYDGTESFLDQLDDLRGFLTGGLPVDHRFGRIDVLPSVPGPPVYLLGSSVESAGWAGARGLPYAYANHIAPQHAVEALSHYRREFRPDSAGGRPYTIATMLVVCSPDSEAAEREAVGAVVVKLRRDRAVRERRQNEPGELDDPILSTEEVGAIAALFSSGAVVVGNPESVRAGLEDFRERTGVDEVMVCCPEYDGNNRIRTLEALCGSYSESIGAESI